MREAEIPDLNASGRAGTSLLRSLQVGFALAMTAFALGCLIDLGAPTALTDIPSNYASGGEKLDDVVEMSLLFYRITVVAPIAEEIVFRAGMLGGLMALFSWVCGRFFVLDRMSASERFWRLELPSFWVPAVLVSVYFVVLHETANPINIMTRMIGAMAMAPCCSGGSG